MDALHIAYDFLDLPYFLQYEIAINMNVLQWDDANLPVNTRLIAWVRRIRQKSKVNEFVAEIRRIKEREAIKSKIDNNPENQ